MLWHTWHDQVAPSEIDNYCQRLIREIVWVTSRRNMTEAQLVGYWKQYELTLLEGLGRLSLYLETPAHVGPLMEAVDFFEKARHEPWTYQADLLSAATYVSSGAGGQENTLLSVAQADVANIDAVAEVISWTGALSIDVGDIVETDLLGGGATPIDLYYEMGYEVSGFGGYLEAP